MAGKRSRIVLVTAPDGTMTAFGRKRPNGTLGLFTRGEAYDFARHVETHEGFKADIPIMGSDGDAAVVHRGQDREVAHVGCYTAANSTRRTAA